MEKVPQIGDSENSERTEQPSASLISRNGLWSRLRRGPEARARFVESHLNKSMAFQVRGMRDRERWSQEELAQRVGMNQNAISRLENPSYGKATITTLKRIARVFDVALMIQFVPFSRLTYWVTGTEFPDTGLRDSYYLVPSFTDEDGTSLGRGAESYQDKPAKAGGLLDVGMVPDGHPGLGRAEIEFSRAAGQ